jgi:hypothetical protein
MSGDKQLRGHITVLLAYPEAFVNPLKPEPEELNDQFVFGTNEDAMVFNVSCGIEDSSFTANFTESETDDERTLCDEGTVQTPISKNYEFSYDGFRDKDVDDEGIFNLGWRLVQTPDRPFYAYIRFAGDKKNNEPFADNDLVHIMGVRTDNPQDIVETAANTKYGARFQYTGEAVENFKLGVD